jgi:hypothetical protein
MLAAGSKIIEQNAWCIEYDIKRPKRISQITRTFYLNLSEFLILTIQRVLTSRLILTICSTLTISRSSEQIRNNNM